MLNIRRAHVLRLTALFLYIAASATACPLAQSSHARHPSGCPPPQGRRMPNWAERAHGSILKNSNSVFRRYRRPVAALRSAVLASQLLRPQSALCAAADRQPAPIPSFDATYAASPLFLIANVCAFHFCLSVAPAASCRAHTPSGLILVNPLLCYMRVAFSRFGLAAQTHLSL